MLRKSVSSWLFTIATWGLYILAWNAVSHFCKKQTGGFSVLKVQSDLLDYDRWKTPIPSAQISELVSQILSQPFHYMEQGGQCFAFLSDDGKYVLKLAKKRSYAFYRRLASLPLPSFAHNICVKKRDKAAEKIDRDCQSYQIAYDELSDLTGIIYSHLSPLPHERYLTTIVDKIGISHTLDLNSCTFLLQKKGEPIASYLTSLEKVGDLNGCRNALRGVLYALHTCVCRGIFDEDPGIHRNFGFAGEEPLFIDVGRFIRTEINPFPPFEKTVERFKLFLIKQHPQLLPLFDEELLRYVPKT